MSDHWVLLGCFTGQSFEGSRILSLHPAVSWKLSSENTPYKIFNDYCSEEKLRGDEDLFFKEQLLWLERFDEFIEEHVPGARGVKGLGQIHINRLKYLIDFVIIQTRYLTHFLDREKPRQVVLVEPPGDSPELLSIYDFKHPFRQSLRYLLEHEACSRGFEFKIQTETGHSLAIQPCQTRKQKSFKELAARMGAKSWLEMIRYRVIRRSKGREEEPVFLFLDAGTESIDLIIRKSVKLGRVFIKQGLEIHEPGKKQTHSLKAVTAIEPDKAEALWQSFENSSLTAWVERYSPASLKVLKPYLKDFLTREVPRVLAEMRKIKRFMMAEKVSAVISRASAGVNYPAALLMAKKLGVPRICFQHSIGPLEMPDWAADELAFHDLNFAMHPSSRDYFRAQEPFFGKSCRVESWSFSLRQRAQTPRKKRSGREVIYYVPAKLAGGVAHFNTPAYPMTWYFEHQKKLLNYFSQRPDFQFVYKHSRLQTWADQSVLLWLKANPCPNIRIIEGVFPKLMGQADRVIFDYPSSGTFEAAAARLPMLALYHKSMKVWEPMRRVLGQSLIPFSDSQQAVSHIHEFLNAKPHHDMLPFPFEIEADPFEMISGLRIEREAAEAV